MKIRIIWWASTAGVSGRGNEQGFKALGHEVDLVTRDITRFHLDDGADLLFSGIPTLIAMSRPALPTITQMGGYGVNTVLPGGRFVRELEGVCDASTIITLLDPNFYDEIEKSWLSKYMDYERIFIVPNGVYMEPVNTEKNVDEFTVFNPSGEWGIKRPEKFVEAARIVEKRGYPIRFKMVVRLRHSYRLPIEWLNVKSLDIIPKRKHDEMVKLYSEADVVTPYSDAEILPTTVFESFQFAKPTICNAMGKVQSVHRGDVRKMISDFSKPVREFDDEWGDKYYSGDHFLRVDTPEKLAEQVIYLYENESERKKLSSHVKEWITSWWRMEDKCRLLIDKMRELGEV